MQPSSKSDGSLYFRLSLMMFLQFAVWGAWSVMIAGHMQDNLHFDGKQISYVFGTTAFGAIISPLIAGWIADRFMPNQIFTGLSHLVGAGLLFYAWSISHPVPAGQVAPFWPLWTTMIIYAFFYFPTISLTNAIAFHHMKDSNKFGTIRVWGTIGWICVQTGLAYYLSTWKHQSEALAKVHQHDCLMFAAIASVLMAIYCFTLPNTPPSKNAKNPYAFLEALKLMENRNFAVLLIISFIVAIELPFYYNLTYLFLSGDKIQGGIGLAPDTAQLAITIGQWGELILMLLLWPMIRYGGMRWTIFLGILAWPVRYAIFAIGHPAWLVIGSQALHGICYSFFFAGGMIAVERLAHKDIRASAQGLMVFATNGLGMLVGHFVSGQVHDYFKYPVVDAAGKAVLGTDGQPLIGQHWPSIFMVPIVVTVIAGIAFLLLFNEKQFQADSAAISAEAEQQAAPA